MGDGTRLGLVLRELDPRRWVFGNRLMSRKSAPNRCLFNNEFLDPAWRKWCDAIVKACGDRTCQQRIVLLDLLQSLIRRKRMTDFTKRGI